MSIVVTDQTSTHSAFVCLLCFHAKRQKGLALRELSVWGLYVKAKQA